MTIKRKLLVYLLLVPVAYSCTQAQNKPVRPVITDIVNKISAYNIVDAAGVGIAGVKTEQYERFENLIKYATIDELVSLTDHKSPTVKAYSFWALSKRKFPGLSLIVKKHAADSSTFRFFSGCLLSRESIKDFYVSISKDQ